MKIKRLSVPMTYKPLFHRYKGDYDNAEPIAVVAWVHCVDDTDVMAPERALLETGEIVTQDEGTFS